MSERGGSADAPGSASTSRGGPLTKGNSKSDLVSPPSAGPAAVGLGGAPSTPAQADSTPLTNAQVYENTYKMKPDRKFQSEPVRRIAEEILQATLKKAKYDPDKVATLSAKIGNDILTAVKKLEYDRYKIVVDVTIGEFKGQGIRVASRSLWDTSTDTYTSASFRNVSVVLVSDHVYSFVCSTRPMFLL
ncbi:UNVERIFIED_CONTAM: Tctex1 domain-containing protein 3 [Siphonaria sp. JEL0065]|nr:Tctex1 domain-containing protein 3 [Siphonaria sp. JEL0065]